MGLFGPYSAVLPAAGAAAPKEDRRQKALSFAGRWWAEGALEALEVVTIVENVSGHRATVDRAAADAKKVDDAEQQGLPGQQG